MAKLDQRELVALRWLLGQLMVLISLAGSFALDLGADAIITGSLLLTGLGCLLPAMVERIPILFWRLAPVALLVFIVSDFVMGGGDFLPPLFRMVLLLTLFRALQVRNPREDLQLLLLTLFLLVVTGVLSQEITFGIQLLFYAPIAMGQLFLVNLATRESGVSQSQPGGRIFQGLRWRVLLRHTWVRMDRQTLLAGVGLYFITTSLALLLFILMPRFDIGAALPFPKLRTDRSLSGFTDHVQYGDVVSILNDDSIAMRVDVVAEDPPARPYWRMVVLDAYYDGGFRVSPQVARNRRSFQYFRYEFEEAKGPGRTDDSEWTLYLEGGISSYLPAADSFKTLRFKNRTNLQVHDLTRVYQGTEINANTLSIRYEGARFDGILSTGIADHLLDNLQPMATDTSQADYLETIAYPQTLLVYPDGEANLAILRRAIRGAGLTSRMPAGEFAARVADYLQRGRGYSLESRIPGGEGDTLLRWADSREPGHCELYAGALVLISRYAGFPARLVTGFAGGDWNGFENYYMVRNRHAHAWCEIFEEGRGWVRVDPTPGQSAGAGSVDAALAGGRLVSDRTWAARLDSLRILWFRRIIQFDSDDQAFMADAVKDASLTGFDWFKQRLKQIKSRLKTDFQSLRTGGQWGGIVMDLLIPAGVLALLAMAAGLVRRLLRRREFEAIMRRKAGQLLKVRTGRGLPATGEAHAALQLVRYGPVSAWPPNPGKLLRKANRR